MLLTMLFLVLLLASWHDIRLRRIPNYVTYGGLVIVFVFAMHMDYLDIIRGSKGSTGTDSLNIEKVDADRGSIFADQKEVRYHKKTSVNDWSIFQTAVGCMGLAIPLSMLHSCGGIGGGDVKLGACIGAFAGLESGVSILFLGHVLAGVAALLFEISDVIANHFQKSGGSDNAEAPFNSLNSKGIPMACFYLVGAFFTAWSV